MKLKLGSIELIFTPVKIILSVVLFFLLTTSWMFFMPGVNAEALDYFIKSSSTHGTYLGIVDFFLSRNIIPPTLFTLGLLSLVVALGIGFLYRWLSKEKDEKKFRRNSLWILIISEVVAFNFFSLLFIIYYRGVLERLMPGGIPVILNPGYPNLVAVLFLSFVVAVVLFAICLCIERDPKPLAVIVLAVLLLSAIFVRIPPVMSFYKKTVGKHVIFPMVSAIDNKINPSYRSIIDQEELEVSD